MGTRSLGRPLLVQYLLIAMCYSGSLLSYSGRDNVGLGVWGVGTVRYGQKPAKQKKPIALPSPYGEGSLKFPHILYGEKSRQ